MHFYPLVNLKNGKTAQKSAKFYHGKKSFSMIFKNHENDEPKRKLECNVHKRVYIRKTVLG